MAHCKFILVLVFVCGLAAARKDSPEGSVCSLRDGDRGVCVKLNKCAAAIKDIRGHIFPVTCSYMGLEPVVCCPGPLLPAFESSISTSPPSRQARSPSTAAGSISKQKCIEYSKAVYRLENTFIPGGKVNVSLCGVEDGAPFIIGGTRAVPKEFPHATLVGYGDKDNILWGCGGSLISPQFVLTAGHCLSVRGRDLAAWARVGDLNIKETTDSVEPQEAAVVARIPHPDYKSSSSYNDIGLLKLEKNLVLNEFVRPACLHTNFDIGDTKPTAIGWGRTHWANSAGSDYLLKVTLPVQSTETCNSSYSFMVSTSKLRTGINGDSMVCAGTLEGGMDTCKGDSGSPLQKLLREPYCMYDIIGVTSFGKTVCGAEDSPGVYTRVSHFVPWIEKIVWP